MASVKTNITMIKNLKKIYADRICAFYGKMVSLSQREFHDTTEEYHKAVMKDIERYAVTTYPFLERKLKCEYRPSTVGTEEISINLKVTRCATQNISELKENMDVWRQREIDAKQRLEDWEEQAIRDAVSKAELPPFDIEG
jgi:hypothetical protein